MPLLKIAESKKVTAIVTLEDATARADRPVRRHDQGSPDEVIQQALDYVFSRDKDFEKFRTEIPHAKPKIALRLKRPASSPATTSSTNGSTPNGASAAR